jgi:hypothetical protein
MSTTLLSIHWECVRVSEAGGVECAPNWERNTVKKCATAVILVHKEWYYCWVN